MRENKGIADLVFGICVPGTIMILIVLMWSIVLSNPAGLPAVFGAYILTVFMVAGAVGSAVEAIRAFKNRQNSVAALHELIASARVQSDESIIPDLSERI